MKKDFLIDAIVGNSRLLACIGEKGELQRLYWPRIDTPQNIGKDKLALVIDNTEVYWLSDAEWQTKSAYLPNTNIYQAVLENERIAVKIKLTIFTMPEEDVLVRRLEITNANNEPHTAALLHYSDMSIGESPRYHTTVFRQEMEALWQFKQNSHFLTSADTEALVYQCKAPGLKDLHQLKGLDHAMCTDGAVLWRANSKEGVANVTLYTAMAENVDKAAAVLVGAKAAGYQKLVSACQLYWKDYLKTIPPSVTGNKKLDDLYKRSLLTFPLLTDYQYGSMLAAPEADEDLVHCGGYGFCWGRDAAFITYAMDLAGLNQAARKFYQWAMRAQNKDGSWEQRHYLDGSIAPNWGMQVDETASIIWGMWQHYEINKQKTALAEFWPTLQKGADFLLSFIDEETGLPKPSYDLWEERKGEHTYSAVAVWAGLEAAAKTANVYGVPEKAIRWHDTAESIRKAILAELWDEENSCFLRGLKVEINKTEHQYIAKHYAEYTAHKAGQQDKIIVDKDPILDISLLGLVFPFDFLPAQDKRMLAIAQKIEEKLTSPIVGGIKRYENDPYIGGNPWILCTLWLALYHLKCGQTDKADHLVEWVLTHQTEVGLLPEQIDKATGQPAWIIPLTWSHAMLILTVQLFTEANKKL